MPRTLAGIVAVEGEIAGATARDRAVLADQDVVVGAECQVVATRPRNVRLQQDVARLCRITRRCRLNQNVAARKPGLNSRGLCGIDSQIVGIDEPETRFALRRTGVDA